MLGRLRMSVDDAIEAYGKLSRAIFGTKKSRWQSNKYSKRTFESVVKSVIAARLDGKESAKLREVETPPCKSFVCTVSAQSIPNARLFRSYSIPSMSEYDCEIWEAARATCAAPTYFERVMIGPEGRQEEFFDGGKHVPPTRKMSPPPSSFVRVLRSATMKCFRGDFTCLATADWRYQVLVPTIRSKSSTKKQNSYTVSMQRYHAY